MLSWDFIFTLGIELLICMSQHSLFKTCFFQWKLFKYLGGLFFFLIKKKESSSKTLKRSDDCLMDC